MSELMGGLIGVVAGIAGLFGALKVLWGNALNKFFGALLLLIPFSFFILMPIFSLYWAKRKKTEVDSNTNTKTKPTTKNSLRKEKTEELSGTLQRRMKEEKKLGK